ncbi:cytosine deaminase [Escherichia coli]|nr:cytosine deaminase [Escherichia coli]
MRSMTSSRALSKPLLPWRTMKAWARESPPATPRQCTPITGAYTSRLFRLLKMSGINFVANPLVNIHLQGRFDTYPKRRGITRVKEMLESGINVCFGHDDVFDPWYPLGTANMLQVLHMGLHVCQLMGYGQINDGLNLITHHSARTLNLQDYGIAAGNSANLIILPAENGV